MPVTTVGEILGARGMSADHLGLAAIGLIAPDARLLPMQEIAHHFAVVHIGGARRDRVKNLRAAVDAKMAFHAEIPLIALRGLMHLGVARLLLSLGCGRRMDDGG